MVTLSLRVLLESPYATLSLNGTETLKHLPPSSSVRLFTSVGDLEPSVPLQDGSGVSFLTYAGTATELKSDHSVYGLKIDFLLIFYYLDIPKIGGLNTVKRYRRYPLIMWD